MHNNTTLARAQRSPSASPATPAARTRPYLLEAAPSPHGGGGGLHAAPQAQAEPRLPGFLSQLPLRMLALLSPSRAAQRAVERFLTPDKPGSLSLQDIRADDGAVWSSLRVDGLDLATYQWGDTATQPYVLLAHDWCGHALDQRALVRGLRAAGYAVVAFDQQAHGRSEGARASLPDFVCNLLAVGWHYGPAAAVIGHGLGGAAAAAALARGLQAERAILIAAQADPVEAVCRFAADLGMGGAVAGRMARLLEKLSGIAMDDLQAHRLVSRIGRPALVVHDLEDARVPWAEGERYARCWQDARFLTTTGLDHKRIAQNPQVIVACLRFLKGNQVGERVVSSPNLPHGFA